MSYLPNEKVDPSWRPVLDAFFKSDAGQNLLTFLEAEQVSDQVIYPAIDHVYRAFEAFPVGETRVVILGQDPYHGPGQAHGLSFSVPDHIRLPPSLKNIYKELESDVGVVRKSGDLSDWARQGVLLLNTALTVRRSAAGSHSKKGWLTLTDSVIQFVSEEAPPSVFILWGNDAIQKQRLIDGNKHCILTSVHPSPLSAYRGFFSSRPFSKANAFLERNSRAAITW